MDGSPGWLAGCFTLTKSACACLMASVDMAPGEQGRKKKKKEVTPLLKWEGGPHGIAELTNKKRLQFSSV